MKKVIFLSGIILCGLLHSEKSFSQLQKTDSLKIRLNSSARPEERLAILNSLCDNLLITSRFNEALNYAIEMKKLALQTIGTGTDSKQANYYIEQVGIAYLNTAEVYRNMGNFDEAIENTDEPNSIFERLKNDSLMADVYQITGTINYQQGDYDLSLTNISAAKKLYEHYGNKKGLSKAHLILGNRWFALGNFSEAMKDLLSSLKLAEEMNDKFAVSLAHTYIGRVHEYLDNHDEAVKHQKIAMQLNNEMGNKAIMALNYLYMARLYNGPHELPKRLESALIAKRIAEEIGDKYALVYICTYLGRIYLWIWKPAEAKKVDLMALRLAESMSDKRGIRNAFLELGARAVEIMQYNEAIEYYKRSLEMSKLIGDKNGVRMNYELLAGAYEANGDTKNGLKYFKARSVLVEEIWNDTKSSLLADMQTKYETEKKDAEITLLNKDKEVRDSEIKKQKTQKYSLIGGLAALAILALVVFNNVRVRNKLKMQTLRNKIASDLHDDVGSTLSSIAIFSEVAQQQTREVIPMLNTISESARKMLDAMADIVWTINPENDNFEKVILRMRSFAYELLGAKKIEFEFKADDDVAKKKLPMDVRKNLYLIFKEATNNLVKYSEANKASFTIKDDKNKLTMLIRDNGKGFDVTEQFIGNGLKNMKKRAEEIGAKLLIESKPGEGTSINLSFHG